MSAIIAPPEGQGKPKRLSISALMWECNSDRDNIKKWLMQAGYDKANLDPALRAEYVKIIHSHQRKIGPGGIHHKTGGREALTYLERKQKEETRKLARENNIAEKALSEEWMTTAAHHAILASLMSKLELIPDKARTDMGLSSGQRDRLQKLLDEARSDAVAETDRALSEGRKRAAEKKD
jgi:hypothetical protein